MKMVTLPSAIMLIAAAAFAWRNQQRLVSVRDTHAKLAAEAALLGIPPGDGSSGRSQRRERPDQTAAAKGLAAEYIAFHRQLQESDHTDGTAKAERDSRSADLIERSSTLSAAQLKSFMAELRATPDLGELKKQRMIRDFLSGIASTQPRSALEFMMKSPDLNVDLGGMSVEIRKKALLSWAEDDPLVAFEWLLANKIKHPDRITDKDIIGTVTSEASTPEQRTAIHAALKEYFATDQRHEVAKAFLLGSALRELAFPRGHPPGFEEASAWITSAQPSKIELEYATEGLEARVKPSEGGQWIEWLGTSGLPKRVTKQRAVAIAKSWTEWDCQAVGEWLNTAPDSPEKSAAVGTYATTVYPFDSENAMKWLQTLPQGPDRTKALRAIYQGLPQDSDAARAFASEQGIN
ncbi:MAG: hypothetical protein B9S38_09705 [Verrucomicrobiia bacterium Tous-C4TDCM]|nr:MAG: hypothetical protein B9S38_09705 [Verrucomicrobiae bacterium Tous-C4TDCM]